MVDTGVYNDNKLSPASANMTLFLPKHRAWITDSAKERSLSLENGGKIK